MSTNDIKKQFIVNSFTQTILSLNLTNIVNILPEEFFQVLLGIKNTCILNLEINLTKVIQVIIYYLRLISGIEIYLIKNNNFFL